MLKINGDRILLIVIQWVSGLGAAFGLFGLFVESYNSRPTIMGPTLSILMCLSFTIATSALAIIREIQKTATSTGLEDVQPQSREIRSANPSYDRARRSEDR